jgi:hypothetical protein
MTDEWLAFLHSPGYEWEATTPGATHEQVRNLEIYCGRPLPLSYIRLLEVANGGVVAFDDLWLIHLWPVHEIPSWCEAYGLTPNSMPGTLPFADDGGSEALVFDIRPSHPDGQYPVLAVNFITIGWREALQVSDSFHSLLLLRHRLLEGAQRVQS